MKERKAQEQRAIEDLIPMVPREIKYVQAKLDRLRRVADFPDDASILDIGAAHGLFVAACQELGYRSCGIEPWDEARANALRLSEHLSVQLSIVKGIAEDMPFDNETFHVVHANSVLEHVVDLEASLSEVFRVLKPGGVFWFSTASSVCPFQEEISGFPLFGWYPHKLKLRIMYWAKEHKPELIGHTQFPAVHWFTPWYARRILTTHGARKVYDRWDIRGENEGGSVYRWMLKTIRMNRVSKLMADVLMPGCSYAAIK